MRFYEDLFTKSPLNLQVQTNIIDDLEISLTDSERDLCEGDFTEEELLVALRGLQAGKSPGP